MAKDSDLLRLNVSRQPIEAGPKLGLSAFGYVAFVSTTGESAKRTKALSVGWSAAEPHEPAVENIRSPRSGRQRKHEQDAGER
jgi:hypothetical protein